ncbi:class I SAM-dependent DNA methyltransferase [Pikeienuella sp. HZG-20]|uniref:class I SAM-dependent DNA methyltransferase n=1 Tax=Paludibacillus litoralis TaxID=3133267 RepID=UPI0030ED62FB
MSNDAPQTGPDADEATLGFYDREGAAYATWSAPSGDHVWLERFISLTPPEGKLLDFGCGGGWATKRMLDLGRRVDAFDGSAALAEEASKLTGINVKVMRFEGLNEAARYAGVWASFCLLHAPRRAMPGHLRRIARALVPGGVFYLGLKRGAGEARDRFGRLYTYFEPEEIRALLAEAGFEAVEIDETEDAAYGGGSETAMHIFSRKGGADG